MQKEVFINFVSERLQDITGYEVRVHEVPKNNGLVLTGLTIVRENRNAYPTIYLDNYYEDYQAGRDMESIVREIKRTDEKYQVADDFDVTCFTDFNKVKANLYYKIINLEVNRERLQNIPHKPILDFAKVYYVALNDERYGEGTVLINNEHLELWGVTADEVGKIARINTETKIQPTIVELKEIVKEKLAYVYEELKKDGEIPEYLQVPALDNIGDCPMYVASNQQNYYGASVMMYTGFLKVISDIMKDDLIILPSSVHEIIFIKSEDAGYNFVGDLREMVENVNKEVVDREEFLSNNVYLYDRQMGKIKIV